MELQAFSSIFEIFATFTLAYIIIDELVENPYVSVISEKVLRVYEPIHDVFSQINSLIDGRRTSVNDIIQSGLRHEKIQQDLPKIERKLESIKKSSTQSYLELKFIIRQKNATRVFVYLNCYLFFYCLTILFYGALYSDGFNEDGLSNNFKVDNSLFLFNSLTLIFLLLGWYFDKPKKEEIKGEKNSFKTLVSNTLNGYLCSFYYYIIAIIFSILTYQLNWNIINFQSDSVHCALITSCVFMPISNFLIYMLKARKRAQRSFSDLHSRAAKFEEDYTNELNEIDDFLGMCNYLKRTEISATNT